MSKGIHSASHGSSGIVVVGTFSFFLKVRWQLLLQIFKGAAKSGVSEHHLTRIAVVVVIVMVVTSKRAIQETYRWVWCYKEIAANNKWHRRRQSQSVSWKIVSFFVHWAAALCGKAGWMSGRVLKQKWWEIVGKRLKSKRCFDTVKQTMVSLETDGYHFGGWILVKVMVGGGPFSVGRRWITASWLLVCSVFVELSVEWGLYFAGWSMIRIVFIRGNQYERINHFWF